MSRQYGRLVFIGDSITQGGNGDHPSYRYKVFSHLAGKGVPINVTNGYQFTGPVTGAQTDRMQARIYGAAENPGRQNQAGPGNAAMARAELSRRGITVIDEKVGGHLARRIDFAPSTGGTSTRKARAKRRIRRDRVLSSCISVLMPDGRDARPLGSRR